LKGRLRALPEREGFCTAVRIADVSSGVSLHPAAAVAAVPGAWAPDPPEMPRLRKLHTGKGHGFRTGLVPTDAPDSLPAPSRGLAKLSATLTGPAMRGKAQPPAEPTPSEPSRSSDLAVGLGGTTGLRRLAALATEQLTDVGVSVKPPEVPTYLPGGASLEQELERILRREALRHGINPAEFGG
jgi:hypothetical protein